MSGFICPEPLSVEPRSAYLRSDTDTKLISARAIAEEFSTASTIRQRQLRERDYRCTDGCKLIWVNKSTDGKVSHFRHQSSSVDGGGGCGCSKTHIDAQIAIQENIHRLSIRTMFKCRRHVKHWWNGNSGHEVVLEKRSVVDDNAVVYDCAAYEATGKLALVLEVKHTHATDPRKRPNNTVEIDALKILQAVAEAGKQDRIILEDLITPPDVCLKCEQFARIKAEEARKRRETEARLRLLQQEREQQRVEQEKELAKQEQERLERLKQERMEQERVRLDKMRQDRLKREAEAEVLRKQKEEDRIKAQRLREETQKALERKRIESVMQIKAENEDCDMEWMMENPDLMKERHAAMQRYETYLDLGTCMSWITKPWNPGDLVGQKAQAAFEQWHSVLNTQISSLKVRLARIKVFHAEAVRSASAETTSVTHGTTRPSQRVYYYKNGCLWRKYPRDQLICSFDKCVCCMDDPGT